jgi:ankyrin repeat protein
VQSFYTKVFIDIGDEVSKFYKRSSLLDQESNWEHAGHQELHFILSLLTQCCTSLKTLLRYGTVNSRGFHKLFQKVNHLLGSGCDFPSTSTAASKQINDIRSKLSTVEFSAQNESLHELKLMKSSIRAIVQVLSRNSLMSQSSLLLNYFTRHYYPALGDLNIAYRAIRDDDVAALDFFFRENITAISTEKLQNQMLVVVLLQLSIIYLSKACFNRLFVLLRSTHKDEATTLALFSSVVVQLLVVMGHQIFATQSAGHSTKLVATSTETTDALLSLLSNVLFSLDTKDIRAVLLTPDPLCKRLPIHYTAQHGLSQACRLLLGRTKDLLCPGEQLARDSVLCQDYLEISPLNLAIVNGNDDIFRLFFNFSQKDDSLSVSHSWEKISGSLLRNAINANQKLLQFLLDANSDVNYQGRHGETALYIAARSGDMESVRLLLSHGARVHITEASCGWTPLIVASMQGYIHVVELLIDAGARPEYRDHSGWTAIEHAAFTGQLTTAEMLKALLQMDFQSEIHDSKLGLPSHPVEVIRTIQPLDGEDLVLVNLTSFELEGKMPNSLIGIRTQFSQSRQAAESEVGLSIQLSLVGSKGASHSVDLPLMEDLTNKPWHFYTNDLHNAKLLFKLNVKTANGDKTTTNDHIGSGIALLSTLKHGLGPGRESLIRDHKIPILSKEDLESIGSISFSLLVVKPFENKSKHRVPARDALWKDGGGTKIVGHRGM